MDFLDGHTRSRDMTNSLGERRRKDFFRLDTELPFPIPLDDVKHLQLQKQRIYLNPQNQLVEVATALLVSNFFFRLDAPLTYDSGFYYCQGSIRCRNNSQDVIQALEGLHFSKLEFVTETEVLAESDSTSDICQVCCRYQKPVSFFVRSPAEVVTVSIRSGRDMERKISGFPQNMQWFETQQGINSPFGLPGSEFHNTLACSACRSPNKRKWFDDGISKDRKRVKK